MKKINLIWLSACAPSKSAREAGGQTFHYYFKNFLEDDRYNIKLISLADLDRMGALEKEFETVDHHFLYPGANKIKKLKNIESTYNPWSQTAGLISNYCADEMIRVLKQYKAQKFYPDIIILEWTATVILADRIKRVFPQAKLIASEHDVTYIGYARKAEFYHGFKKILWSIRSRNEKKRELHALQLCDLILPHNCDNRAVLEQDGISPAKIQWLTPYFHNMSDIKRASEPSRDILFFGAMAREENYLSAIWFIEKVMPRLANLNVRFVVLGSNPPPQLKQYATDKVVITGFVESIDPYFEQSMCLVAPLLLGAGIKVKILEGMSSGLPVLTNEIGIEGIPATDKEHYLHCSTPQEYEAAIRRIITDPHVGRIGEKARSFILERYSLTQSLASYHDRIFRLLAK